MGRGRKGIKDIILDFEEKENYVQTDCLTQKLINKFLVNWFNSDYTLGGEGCLSYLS